MSGHQGHDHSHAAVTEGNAKKLTIALILTTTFLVIEFIAGIITQSLALLSDAAHMFTDAAALAIALAAIKIAKRPADDKRTFGYQRFEILAALFNASMLLCDVYSLRSLSTFYPTARNSKYRHVGGRINWINH
jgi:cobalt-zinc-cadmium efflux system protein